MNQTDAFAPQVVCALTIAMLAWALVPSNPYGYYILLRLVVCGACIYLAVSAATLDRPGWTWVLGGAAVLYNPLIRIHLGRDVWEVVNVATIALLIGVIWMLRRAPRAVEPELVQPRATAVSAESDDAPALPPGTREWRGDCPQCRTSFTVTLMRGESGVTCPQCGRRFAVEPIG